jgi:UDP:flavonoid glycosyltransferase YjiC (YdhE family)
MRIAVVAVGTRGDVEPHAALCQGLRQAGYQARRCAPDDFAPSVAERGIPFDRIPVSFRELYETAGGRALLATGGNGIRFLRVLSRVAVDVAAQIVAGIRAACRQADAVCY